MNILRGLQVLEGAPQELEIIESTIKEKASKNEPIYILEAGCGRRWPFKLEEIQYVLIGVDKDEEALKIRKNTLSDLHATIQGDLSSVDLGANRFDIVYSSFVLEHVKNANTVLDNFAKWIKPDGLLIIRIPDRSSVVGFVTRITPHWFHVFYYRFLGMKNAGKPGYAPYPTYYHPIISRSGIRKFCHDHDIALESEYGIKIKPGKGVKKLVIQITAKVISKISNGVLTDGHTNLLYILRKTAR